MLREISILTRLQLCNIYGFNVFKNNKDKKAKRVYLALAITILILIAIMAAYIGILVYGYITIGLGKVVPAYLIMIASLIILCFGIFKAGPVIFEQKGYNILCSLPVSGTAIVVSRFVRMYVEDMLLALIVMVPGTVVYGLLLKPAVGFYVASVFVTLFVPLAPMTISVILGSCFTAISSRTKYRSIIGALLPIAMLVGVIALIGNLSINVGQITPELLVNFAGILTEAIAAIYPPAVWLGNMMLGIDMAKAILFIASTFVIFLITIFFIGNNLTGICQRLYGTIAKHDFTMGAQEQEKIIVALVRKEFKRYFASTVYFSNTIIGPILAVVMAASLLFIDVESACAALPIKVDVAGILPLVIGTTFCIMNTTSTSISMEGKEWWLIKSLPLTTKQILDGKLLMNLVLFGPFYIISVILAVVAIKPMAQDLLWMITSPAVLIVFSCVWGMFINMKVPVFNWENETAVVKQSVSSLVGGLCSALVGIACVILLILVPVQYNHICKLAIVIALIGAIIVLYQSNNKVKLEEL